MNVWVIALNTFREAVRDKILYVLLVFAIVLIAASRAVGWVSWGGELKIMTDLGLFAVWLFAALVSIFIGTGMIYKEVDKRTLYAILSKPIERWEFLLGKYAGLLLTTFVNQVLLSLVFLAYLWLMEAPLSLALAQALLLIFFEMLVVNALAIFFSSASTPILSAIFTFLLFSFGQLTKWIVDFGAVAEQRFPLAQQVLRALYLFTPNLHNFNIRQAAVLAAGEGRASAISWSEMSAVMWYGVSYSAVVLLAAVLIFRRRNF